MSTIGIDCKSQEQSPSSRLQKICFVLAIAVSCANWLGLRSKGQTSAGSTQKTPTNTPGTKNPEEQVDVDYNETSLIPMTFAAPITILSAHKIDGGAVFIMRPGVMTVHFCNDSIVHVSYSLGDEPPTDKSRSEERRVGKEGRSRWSP